MLKFLKGVVGGSGTGIKDLPYNIGDPYPSAWGSWIHFRATSKVPRRISLSHAYTYKCVFICLINSAIFVAFTIC